MCRQVNGTYGGVDEFFHGTEGIGLWRRKIQSAKLAQLNVPEFKTHDNPYVEEHIALLDSIVKEQPLNARADGGRVHSDRDHGPHFRLHRPVGALVRPDHQ